MGSFRFPTVTRPRLGALLLVYGGVFGGAIVTFVTLPIVLRTLGQGPYGVYALVYTITANLSLLGAGLSAAYLRFYWAACNSSESSALARLNTTYLTIYGLAAGMCLLIGLTTANHLQSILGTSMTTSELQSARELWIIMTINVAVSFPLCLYDVYLLAKDRVVLLQIVMLIRRAASPLIYVPALLHGAGASVMALSVLAVTAVAGTATVLYCHARLDFLLARRGMARTEVRGLLGFSGFLLLGTLAEQFNNAVPRILLARESGAADVAVYSVAGQIYSYFFLLTTGLITVYAPSIYQAIDADRPQVKALFLRISDIQLRFLLFAIGGLLVAGSAFVRVWAGPAYEQAAALAVLLVVGGLPWMATSISFEIQKALALHKFRPIVAVACLLTNVLIGLYAVPAHGLWGAAASAGVTAIVWTGLVLGAYSERRAKLPILNFWRRSGLRSSVRGGLATIAGLVLLGSIPHGLAWIIAVATYILCSVWLLFRKDIRQLVRRGAK